MKKLWWVVVALGVSAVLNTAAVLLGRGSYGHIMFVLKSIAFVGVPVYIAGLVMMIMGRERRRNLFLAGYALNLVSVVIALMIASGFIGLFVAARDVSDAKDFCNGLVPDLEKYKLEKGQYPERVDEIISRGVEPELLLGKTYYARRPEGYVLEFHDPPTRSSMVQYCSWEKEWRTRQ